MKKITHQMLKALLMSKHLKTGLIAYDLLVGKMSFNDCIKLLLNSHPIAPYDIPEAEKEAYIIFMRYVLEGEFSQALETANEENEEALNNMIALQMLQGMLACEDRKSAKMAYEVLAGIESIEDLKKENEGKFFGFVASSMPHLAKKSANELQLKALEENNRPEYKFKLSSVENYHRLNYIMLDQKLNLDEVLNTMIKSYYEVLRADEHAQLMGEDTPQIYYI